MIRKWYVRLCEILFETSLSKVMLLIHYERAIDNNIKESFKLGTVSIFINVQ